MKQSLVCILDILGTKGVWVAGDLNRYMNALTEVDSLLNSMKDKFKELAKNAPIELDFISFSDTLIITLVKSEEDEEKDPYFFHLFIESFSQLILGVFQIYFSNYLFVRGAISFGNIHKAGNHFVGPAIDDAAEYFELQEMVGICLTLKATIAMEYAISWQKRFFLQDIGKYLIKYKTPLKNNIDIDLYQINWVKHFYDQAKIGNQVTAEAIVSSFLSERNIPLRSANKIINTTNFFRKIGEQYF